MTILLDGRVPDDIRELFEGDITVTQLTVSGNAESFLAAFALATAFAENHVAYFVEDDYLHTAQSLLRLEEAFAAVPGDYVTLYDHPDRYRPAGLPCSDLPLPNDVTYRSQSHLWRTVESTCMTFAARVKTLREDIGIFLFHVRPGMMPQDRNLFLHLQGLGYYTQREPRRLLVGAKPTLATHCDARFLAPGVDWDEYVAMNVGDASGRDARA